MSKEVVTAITEEDPDVVLVEKHSSDTILRQEFSFWAHLMAVGDTDNCDFLGYPSFSSKVEPTSQQARRLRNAVEWQNLSTTSVIVPPIVELID
jgi:hypothetical protein